MSTGPSDRANQNGLYWYRGGMLVPAMHFGDPDPLMKWLLDQGIHSKKDVANGVDVVRLPWAETEHDRCVYPGDVIAIVAGRPKAFSEMEFDSLFRPMTASR